MAGEHPQFDVLGFGAVAVDELLLIDQYPPAESKVRVRRREQQCGGLTGTALVAAARLGARCAYVGRIGDDDLSQVVMNRLAMEGVELAHAVRASDATPAHSTILVDRRNHTRTIFASVAGRLGADPAGPEPGLIQAASCILIDHHGGDGSLRAARLARAAGRAVVADFERRGDGPFEEVLAEVDHLVIGRRFARELSGEVDPRRAAQALWTGRRAAVVVTCGADGCWYVGRDGAGAHEPRHERSLEVDVVDTTGCGDVFHGAYAAALAEGLSVEQCVRLASVAAGLKARHLGGQTGCPRREDVDLVLAGNRR